MYFRGLVSRFCFLHLPSESYHHPPCSWPVLAPPDFYNAGVGSLNCSNWNWRGLLSTFYPPALGLLGERAVPALAIALRLPCLLLLHLPNRRDKSAFVPEHPTEKWGVSTEKGRFTWDLLDVLDHETIPFQKMVERYLSWTTFPCMFLGEEKIKKEQRKERKMQGSTFCSLCQ